MKSKAVIKCWNNIDGRLVFVGVGKGIQAITV